MGHYRLINCITLLKPHLCLIIRNEMDFEIEKVPKERSVVYEVNLKPRNE